jgi:hypothetical protein
MWPKSRPPPLAGNTTVIVIFRLRRAKITDYLAFVAVSDVPDRTIP